MTSKYKQYLDALRAQHNAEQAGDNEGARHAATYAASLFFVMEPSEQTVASKEARRLGLAEGKNTSKDLLRVYVGLVVESRTTFGTQEAFELPQDVEELLSTVLTSAMNGENDVTQRIEIAGRHHIVRLVKGPEGYEGRVDGDLFGTGKRPATAMNVIRKRLQFLMTNAVHGKPDPEKIRNAAAKADYDELKRREKLGY